MEFVVKIKETLVREVNIEADCRIEALVSANDMYRQEKIVLDADDFREVAFSASIKKKVA